MLLDELHHNADVLYRPCHQKVNWERSRLIATTLTNELYIGKKTKRRESQKK